MAAVATTPSVPISINQLILVAYKHAGIVPIETRISGANLTPKLEHGRQQLDLILDGLATEGFIARTTSFYDLPIVAGESQYTLPDTILDVFEDAMFVPSENLDTKHTTGELVCKQVDLTTWQLLTTKGSTSTRAQLYVAMRDGATVVLRFWPVPSAAGVMRLKTVRLLGGAADGRLSPDLQRYWHDALGWMLASYLAIDASLPTDKVATLGAMAAQKKGECLRYAREHTGTQLTLNYPTQWSV
jgi:hypothetical protein